MKYLKFVIVGLLIVSLLINVQLLLRISSVEDRVRSVSYSQNELTNRVENQTASLQYLLQDFIKEQSWISAIEMDVKNVSAGKATLDFQWQVKELYHNSAVIFHYKYGEEHLDYKQVQPRELGNGLFGVSIPVEINFEPEWYTGISQELNPNYEEVEVPVEMIIEEQYLKELNKNELSYYVSVSNDDVMKSSEVNARDLGYLGTSYYGYIEVFGHISDEMNEISVMRPPVYADNKVSLNEVYLKKYKNDILIDEEKLTIEKINTSSPEHNPIVFRSETGKDQIDFTSLVLKVVFSDGKSFEKEVYAR